MRIDSQPPRGALAVAKALRKRRALALLYHGLGTPAPEDDPDNLQVDPAAFRRQLELLIAAGFEFVTVAQLADRIVDGRPPAGLVALSFDDGMEDNRSVVLPLLREYGIPATVYVATGVIGEPNPWLAPGSGARMMDRAAIAELAAAGIEIGAHTVTHPDMSQLDREQCLREMLESKQVLEGITGKPVTTFAYPFGHYGPNAVAAAKEAGFAAAATCINRGDWTRYELNRTLITGRDRMPTFVLRIAGIYEPLVLGRAGTAARRATGPLRRALRRGIDAQRVSSTSS